MINLEKLSNDLIANEFFKMFKPMYLVMSFLGSTRFQLKDMFISGTSLVQKLYTIIITSITAYAIYQVIYLNSLILNLSVVMLTIQCVFTYIMYPSIIIKNVFFDCTENALIYVTLQNIDKILKLNKNTNNYKTMFVQNCILMSFFISFQLASFISCCWVFSLPGLNILYSFIFYSSMLVLDCEQVTFACIIKLLQLRLQYVNKLLLKQDQSCWQITEYVQDMHHQHWEFILKSFKSIMVVYYLLQKLYGLYVSNLVSIFIYH